MGGYYSDEEVNISALEGKTITKITGLEVGSKLVRFYVDDGFIFALFHEQAGCEWVRVEDVVGDPDDLVGTPILQANKTSNEANDMDASATWTFYTIATIKGSLTIRWLGESNGYYS